MARPDIPSDGPEASLARVVRRLRLPYSRGFVARLVAAHPRAQTLLAVTEVAPSLGLKATAAEAGPADLAALDLPLIVHFRGSGAGGFGVLEGVTADGFRVWDSAHGARVIGRDAFLASWSGIVAVFERAGGERAREAHHLSHRLAERVFNTPEAPGLAGGRGATALRAALGAVLVALVAITVARAPAGDRLAGAAIALLSLTGLLVTIITAISTATHANALSERICARGKLVDCHSVLTSKYSRVFGISLSDAGIAFFGGILLLLAASAVPGGGEATWAAVGIAYAASIPFSLVLIGTQIRMRQLCTLCLAVHAVNASAAATAWSSLRPDDFSTARVFSALLLLGLFVAVVLFLAVPYFRKSQGFAVVSDMHGRLSRSPFASLAALLTEEPTELRGADTGVRVSTEPAEHELVVLVHPSCNRCTPVLQEMTALAQSGMVDAYVGLVPKEADRGACAAVVAAALAQGPARIFDAYGAAKKSWGSLMTSDPVAALAGAMEESPDPIAARLLDARRMIDRSERLVDAHAEGTPAVFFNGRVFRGPLAHLALLLAEHPDLLRSTLLGADAARDSEPVSPS